MKTYSLPEYVIDRDQDRCIRCKVCVNQCTYDTHYYDEEDDLIRSSDENCVNCQRCVTFCPTNAITIIKNPNKSRSNVNWSQEAIGDLKKQAESGVVVLTGMGCDKPHLTYWDRLLLNASQVTNPSIDPLREPMEIRTYLGSKQDSLEIALKDNKFNLKTTLSPQLLLETPIMFSSMSYGAISLNVHEALARAAVECGT
ncbi:4Fe-4S dicluster domain-containing protein [Candidatus Bathyarchaeota archaeon]|nr:4Fe-4S dicluster domain-containing protein [Candidatus Bathyarchaeota archaeon]